MHVDLAAEAGGGVCFDGLSAWHKSSVEFLGAAQERRSLVRFCTLLLVVAAVGLGATACGGDDEEGAETTTTEETTTGGTTATGREIFVVNCGSCHTLSDADTSGATGPNLDDLSPSMETVEEQVRNGGGGMPAFEGQLIDEEIQEVAAYVSAASGG